MNAHEHEGANSVIAPGARTHDNGSMTTDPLHADAARRLLNSALADHLVVEAVYAPHDADDAPLWAASLINCRCQWFGGWRIEAGPYAGQWAMTPVYRGARKRPVEPGARWVPLAHLRRIQVVGCIGDTSRETDQPGRPVT